MSEISAVTVSCRVNGVPAELRGHPMDRLLDVLRSRAAPDGHEGRMRRRRVRRLLRRHRRPAGEQLPRAAAARATGRRSRRSKAWPEAIGCTPCSRRSSRTAARSAASARREWCWPRSRCSSGRPSRRSMTSAPRLPATCAAAPATCASSRPCFRRAGPRRRTSDAVVPSRIRPARAREPRRRARDRSRTNLERGGRLPAGRT